MVSHHTPFAIRLRDRAVVESAVEGLELGIDPGSQKTGIAVFRVNRTGVRHVTHLLEIEHRGAAIHKKMQQRAAYRRRRRTANLRHRAPRFDNRVKQRGWLAPSLRHRVDSTVSMVRRITRWAPVSAVHQELVRFDLQQMDNPEIQGVEYQQGTLAGSEIREYLLAKWGRQCAYCGAENVPLNIDHIQPRSRGGSDRVSNLTLACVPCNLSKGAQPIDEFLKDPSRLARIRRQAKAPLRDAAAVNSTRWALFQALQASGFPIDTSSGGQTKWNRTRFALPKTHALDAAAVGRPDSLAGVAGWTMPIWSAKATGRGSYSRTRANAHGFPRLHLTRTKRHHGFQTGDLVWAVVTRGQHTGTHVGRVAVRSSGSFALTLAGGKIDGINHRCCRLLQRAAGWEWAVLLPALKDRVSAQERVG